MQSRNIIQYNNFRIKNLELKSVFKRNNLQINNGRQTSGLPPVASFVPLGCSSQSFLLPFHRPLATKKKSSSEKRAALFLLSALPVSTRSLPAFVGATTSATPQPNQCQRYAVFASVAPYFFSGCSFAQPSGFAPLSLCIGLRNANADFYFFPAVTRC
jgi:hypothetical protein